MRCNLGLSAGNHSTEVKVYSNLIVISIMKKKTEMKARWIKIHWLTQLVMLRLVCWDQSVLFHLTCYWGKLTAASQALWCLSVLQNHFPAVVTVSVIMIISNSDRCTANEQSESLLVSSLFWIKHAVMMLVLQLHEILHKQRQLVSLLSIKKYFLRLPIVIRHKIWKGYFCFKMQQS